MSKLPGILVVAICLALGSVDLSSALGVGQTASASDPSQASRDPQKPAITETTESAGGYTYSPGGRRDPFVSLLLGRATKGPSRKQGLLGQQISEVDLVGIAKDAQGYMAMIRGSDQKTYFVRVGTELADGRIIDISQNKVTFREEIKDPFSLKPYRDIVKTLTAGGEEE